MKIAFIISSLGSGGAERVLSLMANYWTQKNYRIVVITLDNSTPFYSLEDGVKLEKLSLLKNSGSVFSAIANNIIRIKIIKKKLIEIDPDIKTFLIIFLPLFLLTLKHRQSVPYLCCIKSL